MAQIPGKAGGRPGRKHRRGNAEYQGNQGVEHQHAAVAHHRAHVRPADALVNHIDQHQGNFGFHVDLTDHGDRSQNRVPFVFPDTPDQGFYHAYCSSFSGMHPLSGCMFSMARCKKFRNSARSSGVNP